MARRKSMEGEPCPVARSLGIVGDRWSMLIVRDSFDGTRRFGDFQRNLGVARNILADRLRVLVVEGILTIQAASDGTSYQEYALTPKGEDLFPIVVAMRQWGERYLFKQGEEHSRLVEKETGETIAEMEPRSHDGRALKVRDTTVRKTPLSRPPAEYSSME
jgi:DNA-binding HxlR family transcriptional regulator